MSSRSISPEALAEFIHLNCTREYGMEVIDKLEAALKKRDYTIQTIYDVIDALNGLQPTVNKLQVITFILDAALAIGTIASMFSPTSAGYSGIIITQAQCMIKNSVCNGKVKHVREAMVEDKKHRDRLESLLRQQEIPLSFEVTEFKAELGTVHEIILAISKCATGNSIDWIKHMENLGVVGITLAVPSSAKQNTDETDKSNYSLSDILKTLMKAIDYLERFVGERLQKVFLSIKAIISLLCNCSKVDSEHHPTADLLETRLVPELMHDAVMLQELQEELIRNYKL